MRKYKKAKIVFEDKAIDKKRKPIYATRKLSIGLVSCMLGVMLFVPTSKADEENPLPTSEQIEKNTQPEQTQDLKAGLEETTNNETPENNQEELLTADEIQEIRNRTNNLENSYFFNGNMVEELKAELRKAKADPSVNYEEAKASLINEAIIKHTPAQKAPGEDRAAPKSPKVNPMFLGNTEITGSVTMGKNQRKIKKIDITITVTVNRKAGGTEVKNVVVPHTQTSQDWSVTLDSPLVEGDTVTVTQAYGGETSDAGDPIVPEKAMKDKYKDTLKMPTGEIWIEQYVANIVNEEEKAEALDLLKKANPTIANDISSVDFVIEGVGTKTASYTVTYKDNSQTEKILAPKLTVKEVTEYSAATNVEKLVVTDTKITGKLVPQKKVGEDKFEPDPNGKIAEGTKVIAILNPSGNDGSANYCTTGKCSTDKNSSTIGEATVNSDGTFEINVPNGFDYKQEVGLTVKEPHKFKACNSTTVEYVIPKVLVRDPKKLTDEEKKTIEDEIRKANTIVKGDGSKISKLPDWTVNNIPAYIDIDKDGNVKIINPAEVDGDWIDDYTKFVPKRNPDGSLKMSTGNENSGIPVTKEELLENKAPDAPTISTNVDDGKITITPNPLDTDAKKIEVKYTDPKGVSKTATATKGDNGEWSVPEGSDISVDKTSGVVTITFDKIKNKTNVDAKVTDDGGIANNDKDKKTSDNKSETIRVLPKKPDIKVDKNTGDVTITPIEKKSDRVAKKMDVTYTPAGETESKTVTFTRDEEGKWSVEGKTDFEVSQDGKTITIKNNKIKADTKIKAETTDGETDPSLELLKSGESEGEVKDKTAPKAPEVSVNTNDGSAQIKPPTDKDTKTVTVKYPDPNGSEKTAIATKENDGWKITQGGDDGVTVDSTSGIIKIPYGKMKKADTVSATAKDESKNESQSSTDTTLPPVPNVEVNTDKKVVVTPPADTPAVNGMEITYTPAGESKAKTINIVKDNEGNWKLVGDSITGISVESSGKVTFDKGIAKELSNVTAKSKIDENKKGLETAEKQVPDTTAPEKPEVKVQKDGSVTITPKKDSDTKTVTVTYKDNEGNEKTAIATKGDDGWKMEKAENGETVDNNGVITIPTGKTNPGDKVFAKAKDPSDNESGPSDDTTMPAPPTITPDQESGDVTITPPTKGNLDGMDIEYKTPDNTDRKVRVVKGDDKKWKIEGDNPDGVTVAEDTGVVTISKGKAKEKTEVIAKSTLGEKKAPAEKTPENQHQVPDKTAPEAPKVEVQKDGSVTITPKKDSDTKTVTVTYKDENGNEKTAIATKGDDGWKMQKAENGETVDSNGVITIPTGKSNPGDVVKATAKDPSDNESDPSDDTTMPAPPIITPDQKSGNVTITPPKKGNLDGMDIEYQTPSGEKRTVRAKKDNNKWTIEGDNPDGVTVAEDTGLVTIPKGKAKEKTEVKADSTLGKKKAPAEKTPENQHQVPDKTAPNPPTVEVDTKTGNLTITPPKDEDTTSVTVTYKKADNTEIKVKAKKDNQGKWTLTKEDGTSQVDNGESVDETSGVITLAKGKYKTGEIVKAYGNDNVNNQSREDNKTPVEVTIDVNGGKQNIDSSILAKGGNYVLPEIYDKQYFPENKEFVGWEVESQTKNAGETIKINANTTIKAVWKDIEYKVTFNGNTGTGKMDEKLVKKGNEYELPANGFTAPEGKKFDGWMVGTEKKAVGAKITVNADTEVKAVWKDIEYKVTFNGNTGTGSMTEATVKKGKEYTLPENGFTAPEGKKFDGWMIGTEKKAVGAKITVNSDTEVKAIWKDIEYKVTFNGNTGTGKMDEKLVKKGDEYTLPENSFTAPEGKIFDVWMIGTEKKAVGAKITVNSDTEVKAIWKDIEYKVSFNGNAGTGSMTEATVKKGEKYKLPENKFQAPTNKEFKTWEVDGKE
ncbi:MAG: InlB B-repeat-containing protein, partial [Anaerococcus vaginalis]|nr:InlB B-repeat-containing protein [Anaerococcus vaginalis]